MSQPHRASATMFAMLLLAACNPPIPEDTGPADTLPAAATFDLSVGALDFGEVVVGATSTALEVTITATGADVLEIAALTLEDPTQRDQWSISPITSILLPAPAEATFTVAFSPIAAGLATNGIWITTNAPDSPTLLPLSGVGVLGPDIRVDPDNDDFGDFDIGCSVTRAVTVTNAGDADLVVTDLAYESATGELTLEPFDALPWTLAPAENRDILVRCTPGDTTLDEGVLAITSNDPLDPVALATQVCGGHQPERHTDTFVQGTDRVDVLVRISSAATMADELTSFSSAWPTWFSALDELDHQVGVVNDADGCATWLDASMTVDDRVAAMPVTPVEDPRATAGFDVVADALAATSAGGCNEGRLRSGAHLAVVDISDVEDTSAGAVEDYVTAFEAYASDAALLDVYAIGGDYPTGCGTAEGAVRWMTAADATGGTWASICADPQETLDQLVAVYADLILTAFSVSGWPDADSIAVTVDGAAVEGWSYAEGDNAVEFEEAPPDGSVIVITWSDPPECP
jgi:hypothetical protein